MQLDRLIRVFSAILTPLAVGCAEDSIDTSQFSEDLCAEGSYRILGAVEPAVPADYLELRDISDYGYGDMPEWSPPNVVDASGARCSGATDVQACGTAFDALPPESEFIYSGFDVGQIHRSVAFTRGDEVGRVADQTALNNLLGPLDAPGDAALLAVLQGHTLVCEGGNDVGVRGDGYVLHTTTGGGCGEGDDIEQHVIFVRPDGTIEVLQTVLIEKGDPGCAVGRLPAGLCHRRRVPRTRSPVGSFFAEVAHLEAAAVTAFEQLATELTVHGAPRSMVAAAMRARNDEVRHARQTASLARRYGGRPVRPRVGAWAPRTLGEVASDNAAEGCIRETYGALVAHAQAIRARDPEVRSTLRQIARDETRHAALSWDLARWADRRMTPRERRRTARDTAEALERLEGELTQAHADEVHTIAGMPSPDQARAMYGRLKEALFLAAR